MRKNSGNIPFLPTQGWESSYATGLHCDIINIYLKTENKRFDDVFIADFVIVCIKMIIDFKNF